MINYKRTQTTRPRGAMAAPMRDLMFGDFDLESMVKGLDVLHLGEGKDHHTTFAFKDAGANAYAYDPYSDWVSVRDSYKMHLDYDIIVSSYVYNVIPPAARRKVWLEAQRHSAVQIWAVRADRINGDPWQDGVLTSISTFQKSYTIEEAKSEWPNATVIAYYPGKWITLFQSGLLYPRNLSVPIESRVV